MLWISKLRPDADEILLLAGFGHDVERARPDRYTRETFATCDEYKHEHARKAGEIATSIAIASGYSPSDGDRLAHIIAEGEFSSDEPDVQLLCDADSISFFDNNASYYLADKGPEWTKKKMRFAYERASDTAKRHIKEVLATKPELDLAEIATSKLSSI